MIQLLLATAPILVILLMAEYGWHRRQLGGEFGRKFVHISVGSFVAFWPYFLSWNQIRFLSAAFLVVVVLSSYLGIFKAIRSIQRPTYGDIFFALVVGILTFVTLNKVLYTTAILQMSLADGLAAIVGTRFGKGNTYHIAGHAKSVIGTLAFLVVSLAILFFASAISLHISTLSIIFIAIFAAIIENIAILGFDNLLVPLVIVLLI